MTYLGTVQNGVIVLAGGQSLPEGTSVIVAPQATAADKVEPTLGNKVADLAAWADQQPCDLPSDLAENHHHYLHGLPTR